MQFPITCVGIPKTVDNDLPITDTCPGFGSVAAYVAVSIHEAGLDVASMSESSTKVFVMEVMGAMQAGSPELPDSPQNRKAMLAHHHISGDSVRKSAPSLPMCPSA